MNVIHIEDERISGVKIFDGIENGKLFCKPRYKKYFYKTGSNRFYGKIKMCESGFHFCLDMESASTYKELFKQYKKHHSGFIIAPVACVTSYGYKNCIAQLEPKLKLVTDELYIHSLWSNVAVIDEFVDRNYSWLSYNQIIKSNNELSVYRGYDVNASIWQNFDLFFQRCKSCSIEIDNQKTNNSTIFSPINTALEIINKSKYTQYVNRYDHKIQTITALPRKSEVRFDSNESGYSVFRITYDLDDKSNSILK